MKNKSPLLAIVSLVFTVIFTVSCSQSENNMNRNIIMDEIIEKLDDIDAKQADSLRQLLPQSVGNVNDYEELFSTEQMQLLAEKINLHEQVTTNEIGIVTTADFSPYDNIDDYSLELFNKWGIGKKDKDNGVLITVSQKNKIVRITTGIGVGNVLTDSLATSINDEIMIPFFKEGDYYGGVNAGLEAVIEIIE